MSLDVYLEASAPAVAPGPPVILIRENGATREISLDEWNERFPGQRYVAADVDGCEVYWRNITHNLNKMADAAGVYKHLWRPDELGITKAGELIAPLAAGLLLLKADPERFKAHNPPNGWGDYDGLVAFVADYLEACKANPEAVIRISR